MYLFIYSFDPLKSLHLKETKILKYVLMFYGKFCVLIQIKIILLSYSFLILFIYSFLSFWVTMIKN